VVLIFVDGDDRDGLPTGGNHRTDHPDAIVGLVVGFDPTGACSAFDSGRSWCSCQSQCGAGERDGNYHFEGAPRDRRRQLEGGFPVASPFEKSANCMNRPSATDFLN
jgi:hypothetical protein